MLTYAKGLKTEQLCDAVADMLTGQTVEAVRAKYNPKLEALKKIKVADDIDEEAVRRLFNMHYRTIEQARQI